LFTSELDDHFQGMHQVILPKITSYHLPIFLYGKEVSSVNRPFKFENMWLEEDGFSELVKSFCSELQVSSSPSFILAKKVNFLKLRLK